ncbi:MAG: hypothetical protein HAW67_05245 [Endozoicomonadaceae bacterium]|nr:hypothetical protein [Endozoicomonadaceae bacterium]
MKRSSQSAIKAIFRELGQQSGETKAFIKKGQEEYCRLANFFREKGYNLTPYINGDLNLTWTSGKGSTAQFHRLLTSVSEVLTKPNGLLERANTIY